MRCVSRWALAGVAWAVFTAALAQTEPRGADLATLDYRLQARELAAGVWVIEGAVDDFHPRNGCNIINTGWIQTEQGVVLINTGPSKRYGEQQRQALSRALAAVPPAASAVREVLNLNLHPDYFFGNQAWADVPTRALSGSIEGMRREGGAYADNLYALCGDWMSGTESTPAQQAVSPGVQTVGGRSIELLRYEGHTGDDLVVIDHRSGVVFAGGLVFTERIPTTPHADIAQWLRSLDQLQAKLRSITLKALVPSHGPVYPDARGIEQTRDYLTWLHAHLSTSAAQGLDLAEVLAQPLPQRFAAWAAARAEYARNVTQLYPDYERQALRSTGAR
jgi:quinoprotein relay system zinc metallohydrolase 1